MSQNQIVELRYHYLSHSFALFYSTMCTLHTDLVKIYIIITQGDKNTHNNKKRKEELGGLFSKSKKKYCRCCLCMMGAYKLQNIHDQLVQTTSTLPSMSTKKGKHWTWSPF